MKVVRKSLEIKLAAVFVLFAAALVLSANVSSRLSLAGVSIAHAGEHMDNDVDVVVNNAVVNEDAVSGDMAI